MIVLRFSDEISTTKTIEKIRSINDASMGLSELKESECIH